MTKEMFNEWKAHKITQEILKAVTQAREVYVDQLACGGTLDKVTETARCVGVIQGLDYLLNINFEDTDND